MTNANELFFVFVTQPIFLVNILGENANQVFWKVTSTPSSCTNLPINLKTGSGENPWVWTKKNLPLSE
jgi:hypothetical protein